MHFSTVFPDTFTCFRGNIKHYMWHNFLKIRLYSKDNGCQWNITTNQFVVLFSRHFWDAVLHQKWNIIPFIQVYQGEIIWLVKWNSKKQKFTSCYQSNYSKISELKKNVKGTALFHSAMSTVLIPINTCPLLMAPILFCFAVRCLAIPTGCVLSPPWYGRELVDEAEESPR